jgi:hypothetical protein
MSFRSAAPLAAALACGAPGLPGAAAWRKALAPLAPDQRKLFVDTLPAYEVAVGGEGDD